MDERKSDLVAKVPQVTLLFWIIKILATTLGETGGDAVTMSWLGETTAAAKGTGYLMGNGNLRCDFRSRGARANQGKKISPVPLLANDRRNDDGRDHPGGLLRQIARHRLHRWFDDLADLRDCVASDLALVDRSISIETVIRRRSRCFIG